MQGGGNLLLQPLDTWKGGFMLVCRSAQGANPTFTLQSVFFFSHTEAQGEVLFPHTGHFTSVLTLANKHLM